MAKEVVDKGLGTRVASYIKKLEIVNKELDKTVVGQQEILDGVLRAIIANGHVLVEGVPGIAKTLIIRSIAEATGCEFKRIQFTPDLLPSDILGAMTYRNVKGFYIIKGPIFANFVLADEINRAPPKVQSALLESMQEKQVTIGKETYPLPNPFFVMATQNPIESLGTYPLPEAQVDRFLFKLLISYPSIEEESFILERNMTIRKFDEYGIKPVLSSQEILAMQEDVKKIYIDPKIEKYIVRIIDATRYPEKYKLKLAKYVEWGSSPRGSIGLHIGAKADALMQGKLYATPENVKRISLDVLRHRIILNYEGQAEGIKNDDIIKEILSKIPVP